MAESDMPTKPGAAVRWALGGIVLFVLVLQCAEDINTEQYEKAALWGIAAIALFLILFLWSRIAAAFAGEAEKPAPPARDLRTVTPKAAAPPRAAVPERPVVALFGAMGASQAPDDKIAPWLSVNVFRVAQASCLWVEKQPSLSFMVDKSRNPIIGAAEQLIVTELKPRLDLTHAHLSSIGDFSDALVTRADLVELAKRTGASPSFLVRGPGW